MIRIDLLTSAEDRRALPDARRPAWTTAVGGSAIVVVAVALVVWWSWALRGEAAEVSQALADAQATLRRLAPAVEGVRAAEARQADLGGRMDRIEALHARRNAAVRMLDHSSRALPDGLWLGEVREDPAGVVVRGHAVTLETVSDYAAALEAAGAFGMPVEIVDSQRGEASGARTIVSFEIRMPFPALDRER